jgi:hypothetical protein
MFKERLIEKPKEFFSEGFDENGLIIGSAYKEEVLALGKGRLEASLLWFRKAGALSDDGISAVERLRQYRNELAHEMAEFIGSSEKNVEPKLFDELVCVFLKLEKWWFQEFELALQPGAISEDADPDDVLPGQIWFINLMRDIALGREPSDGYYYDEYKKLKTT